tara:strand:- start:9256 stop:9813 length:558 start_codon:yes stop_codon:yes gene_type:complete
MPLRRKRQCSTDYKKRLKLLKSGSHRLVVRASLKGIIVSLNKYNHEGDVIEVNVSSNNLSKFGWKSDKGNVPSAYLTGYLAGKIAASKKIQKAILDVGLKGSVKGSRIYAAVAGAIDGGLEIPQSEEMFPDKERINGSHISKYAEQIKSDKEKYELQFGKYLKNNLDPTQLTKHFEEVKTKISNS